MNQITLLRIMLVLNCWDQTTFPFLMWVYAAALEIEWWCAASRNFLLEDHKIKKLSENKNILSEK